LLQLFCAVLRWCGTKLFFSAMLIRPVFSHHSFAASARYFSSGTAILAFDIQRRGESDAAAAAATQKGDSRMALRDTNSVENSKRTF
jgi:hypothetical protein